jgi:hypothetical protein
MSAFAAAMDAIFLDPNMAADALWFDQGAGPGVPCRVIRSAPDEVTDYGGARIRSETTLLDVRVAEIATVRSGDEFLLGTSRFRVQGAPVRDRDQLIWSVDTVPV